LLLLSLVSIGLEPLDLLQPLFSLFLGQIRSREILSFLTPNLPPMLSSLDDHDELLQAG
jgi:hypothetical protein